MSAKNQIQMDELLREIIDDLYEEDKDKMIESKEDLFLALLFDLHIRGSFNLVELEDEKTYSIEEILKEFLEGKKKSEFYDAYTGGRRRENLPEHPFDCSIDYDLVHNQIASTWGTSKDDAPYQSKQIPASSVPNVLLMLKLFYHPVQKAIRTHNFKGVTSEDYDHYINALKNEGLERPVLNEYSLDYLLETTLHTELYKEIAKVKKELDEYLISDLVQLREMNDPVRRLLYVRWYGAFMKRSVEKWRGAVEATKDFQNKVLDSFVEEISEKEYELMQNADLEDQEIIKIISRESEESIQQKFHRDHYDTGYKSKEDFLTEDYKAIMRAVTEEIARKKEYLNELENYIDSIMKE